MTRASPCLAGEDGVHPSSRPTGTSRLVLSPEPVLFPGRETIQGPRAAEVLPGTGEEEHGGKRVKSRHTRFSQRQKVTGARHKGPPTGQKLKISYI